MELPNDIRKAIDGIENSDAIRDEHSIDTELRSVVSKEGEYSADEKKAIWAEWSSVSFMAERFGSESPWGTYFSPLAVWQKPDGTPAYSPDAAEITQDVIEYWRKRARQTPHIIWRARYADLSWDFAKYSKTKADIEDAILAIDSYLHCIATGFVDNEHQVWRFCERAIELSILVSDQARVSSSKNALFSIYRSARAGEKSWIWWRPDDIASRYEKLNLSQSELDELVAGLEEKLKETASVVSRDSFDPWGALAAAERLARYRKKSNNKDRLLHEIRMAIHAFEFSAEQAVGMASAALLESALEKCHEYGLEEDAARIEKTMALRRDEIRNNMKKISTKVEIDKKEIDDWYSTLLAENVDQAFKNIADAFLIKESHAAKSVEESKKFLLSSLFTTHITSPDGFTSAKIGSIEDDPVGRLIHEASRSIGIKAVFLVEIFEKLRGKYNLDADAVIIFIKKSECFDQRHIDLIKAGISAWMDEDWVKAVYILVPQVEAALRNLLRNIGGPTIKPARDGGFRVLTMGDILNSPIFRQSINDDVRLHFRTLYTEVKGINLRNDLAHGRMTMNQIGRAQAAWVVHSLLYIARIM